MNTDDVRIEWVQVSGKDCLRFVFGERLTEPGADAAIAAWERAFRSKKDAALPLIWDCRKMKGYDTAARSKWIDALKKMKSQIGAIWLISESSLIRMGASVMSMLSGMEIKPIKSESEIVL